MKFATHLTITAACLVIGACGGPDTTPAGPPEQPGRSIPEGPLENAAATSPEDARQIIPGRWAPVRKEFAEEMTAKQLEAAERLAAIGYLDGSREAPGLTGVVHFDEGAAYPGLNFYVSGHAPEALLTDMQGNVIHAWSYPIEKLDVEMGGGNFETWKDHFDSKYWRRARVLPNGDLIAIFEGLAIIRIDKDSNLIWAKPNRAHHDLDILDDGTIYTLTRVARMRPDLNENEPVLEDFLSILNGDGEELRKISLLDAFLASPYSEAIEDRSLLRGDVFHTNSVKVLDGRLESANPAFRQGNVLISLRNLDAIAVVDLDTETFAWFKHGGFNQQHDPRILDNGNMLMFDNMGRNGKSGVLEVDVERNRLVWQYTGTDEKPLFSRSCGTAQRLPNGNTLITESDAGRAIEVTPDKEIVWEFYNPHRAGETSEYIATLFELSRIPGSDPPDWLAAARAAAAE